MIRYPKFLTAPQPLAGLRYRLLVRRASGVTLSWLLDAPLKSAALLGWLGFLHTVGDRELAASRPYKQREAFGRLRCHDRQPGTLRFLRFGATPALRLPAHAAGPVQ
jgi:hypothetical protein